MWICIKCSLPFTHDPVNERHNSLQLKSSDILLSSRDTSCPSIGINTNSNSVPELTTTSTSSTTTPSQTGHITTNRDNFITYTDVQSTVLSDHRMVHTVRKATKPTNKPQQIKTRTYRRFDPNAFIHDVSTVPWINVYEQPDVGSSWITWKVIFLRICDKHAPYKNDEVCQQVEAEVGVELRRLRSSPHLDGRRRMLRGTSQHTEGRRGHVFACHRRPSPRISSIFTLTMPSGICWST